jgi:hypothetical protein
LGAGEAVPRPNGWGFDDWPFITAHYRSFGASVWTSGPITLTVEFRGLLRVLKIMDEELRGKAEFNSLDPGLKFSLEMNKLGQIAFDVDITPDHMTQKHTIRRSDKSIVPSGRHQRTAEGC